MASLHKRKKSPFYWAAFTLPDGRRVFRSTKTADRKTAQKLLAAMTEATERRATADQVQRILSDVHESIHGTPLITVTLADYARQFLERKKDEAAAVTLASYKGIIADFIETLGDKANQPISYITKADLAKWRDTSAAKTSARTVNNKLKVVRTLFQSAWRDGLITDNHAAKIPVLKTSEGNRRPFTIPELQTLLAVCNYEWRGLVLAGVYTGQRLKDVASLTWGQIDFESNEIVLFTSKTGRRQRISIAPPLLNYINSLRAPDAPLASTPLFPNAYPHACRPGGTSCLSKAFHDILADAGFVARRAAAHPSKATKGRDARRDTSPLSYHSLRHMATSLLKNAGVSEVVVRDLIGHDSAAVSANYTHVDSHAKRAAIALLPDITQLVSNP
jgi:integrase